MPCCTSEQETVDCLEDAVRDLTIRSLHKLCSKIKSGTIPRLAQGLGIRETLEDLCTRFPQFRQVPPGETKQKLQEGGSSAVTREKRCEYLASQSTEEMGAET